MTTTTRSRSSKIDSAEEFTDKIWSNLESKLNQWVKNVLPDLAEAVLKAKAEEVVAAQVDNNVSSKEFQESLSKILDFDQEQLKDNMNRNLAKMADLIAKNRELEAKTDHLEQYTRRTNIRIFGIKEQVKEDTDQLAKNFCKDELGIILKDENISRSHRVGKKSMSNSVRPRPTIVRLTRHNTKVDILRKRRQLKERERPYSVQEDLTEERRSILKYLREEAMEDIIARGWAIDGVICFRPKSDPEKVERCNTICD